MDLFKAEIGGEAGLGGTDVSLAIVIKLYIDGSHSIVQLQYIITQAVLGPGGWLLLTQT